ncbi:hypothetical protein ACWJQD_25575, partial [Klebsiella pneumoniae]
ITPSVAEQEGQQTETEATGAPQKHHYTLNQQVGSITALVNGLGYKEILDQQGNFLLTVEMRDQLQNVLDANMMLADKLNYSGTPVFIVMNMKNPQNKTTTIMPGAPDFYRLQQAIDKAKGN